MQDKLLGLFFCMLSVLQPLCAAEPRHIKIGVIVPLSGGWAEWGQRIRQGIELYQSSQAEAAVEFEFLYQDEATCDAAKAYRAYKFLRAAHDVKIFILGCMTGARAILPLAQREGVLLLSAGFQEQGLFVGNKSLVNLALQIGSGAENLAEIIGRFGIRRLALLREVGTDDYLAALNSKTSHLGNVNFSIVLDQTLEGTESDIRTHVLQAISRRADALFLNVPPSQIIQALRIVREQKPKMLLLSSYGIEWLAATNSELRSLANGVLYSHPASDQSSLQFQHSFEQRFQVPPVVNNYFVYDGLVLLNAAIEACPLGGTDCLFQYIANDDQRVGVGGSYRIRTDGSIDRVFESRRLLKLGFEKLDYFKSQAGISN